MSGTLTPGAPADFYRKCVDSAQQAGAISILDARGAPLIHALAAGPRVVKPNQEELATTFGQPLQGESSVLQAIRNIHERGAQNVVVTAGKEPTIAFDGKNFRRIVGPDIRAVNPIGSGDAFTAGLAFRLVQGEDFGEACRWGSAAGAANALTLMAGEAEAKEVERLVRLVRIETIPA
jgi:tagatose 6-phosphate kinase